MEIYPIKKLIIIYGLHLENISRSQNEEKVNSILTGIGFTSEELIELDILVFKNPKYTNQNIRTHIVIDSNSLVSNIHYYNKTVYV